MHKLPVGIWLIIHYLTSYGKHIAVSPPASVSIQLESILDSTNIISDRPRIGNVDACATERLLHEPPLMSS